MGGEPDGGEFPATPIPPLAPPRPALTLSSPQSPVPSPQSPVPHPDSVAVHAGRGDLRALGVHALPIDLSTTYPFERLDDAVASLDAMMGGAGPTAEGGAVYSRLHSPTVARFEAGYAAVEGAEAGVAFASGMAAITAALLAAREEGRNHVVGVRPTYGTTDRLLSSGLLGLDVTWTDEGGVAAAVRDDTARRVRRDAREPDARPGRRRGRRGGGR